MIKKTERLSKKKEIEEVRKDGRVLKGIGAVYLWLDNKEESKFGVSISKKIDKRAVVRNKIRRRIMEVIRESRGEWPRGWMMVMVRSRAIGMKLEDWAGELGWARSKIITK